jgi:hypothetical protein
VFVSQSVDGVIYVARVPPAELLEPFTECSDPSLSFRVALTIGHQHADPPHPPCCARAASGQAAAPPSSVRNWRRFKSSMGSSPEPAVPAYSRRRMPRKRPAGPWGRPESF